MNDLTVRLMKDRLKSEYTSLRTNFDNFLMQADGPETFTMHKETAIDILNAYRRLIRKFYNARVNKYDFENCVWLKDLYDLCWVKKPQMFDFLHKDSFIKNYTATLDTIEHTLWKET